ncbi:hypothetical protein M9458_043921, partial [Cirrhinus mrigala]
AESLLTLCKECSYLVRNSETSRLDYSLSLRYGTAPLSQSAIATFYFFVPSITVK